MNRELRFLADLTPPMRKALVRCYATTILIDTDHGIHPATLAALQRHHLIEQGRDKRLRRTWKPTDRGMQVIKTQPPHLLRAGVFAGYTTEIAHALHDEPEAIDRQTVDMYAESNAERHQTFKAAHRAATQPPLHERVRRLEAAGDTVRRNDLAAIQRRVEAAERKLGAA